MKLYLKKAILFFIVIGSIVCVMELLVRSTSGEVYSLKNDFMLKHRSGVETLILGASHNYNGVRPDLFSSAAYNLAIPAQGLKIDSELLSGYIDGMPNLKNVIVGISYFSFRADGFANKNSDYLYINYKLYMEPKVDCDFKYNFAVSDSRFVKYRLIYLVSNTQRPVCDSLGWWGEASNTAGLDGWQRFTEETIRAQTYERTDVVQKNIEYLTNIIELCNERSIRLIAITPPTWNIYYNSLNEEQYLETQYIMAKMQKEYNVEYYNFMKDSRFVESDFYNVDHLSNIGAEKFTRILVDTLDL